MNVTEVTLYLTEADSEKVGHVVTETRELMGRLAVRINAILLSRNSNNGLVQVGAFDLAMDMIKDCHQTMDKLNERFEIDPDDGSEIEY